MTDTKMVEGFIWPASDSECAAVVFDSRADLEHAYAHCRGFAVAVQAGGNCGVWPAAMGARFGTVYTFEPDSLNFMCLAANAKAANIFKFNAALGCERRLVELDRAPHNAGAHQVSGAGQIPTLMIDDLGLEVCDLIYLDIEGSELAALRGAERTIEICRPVIAIEDKGLSERYGVAQGQAEEWLAQRFSYLVVDRVGRDVILTPPSAES